MKRWRRAHIVIVSFHGNVHPASFLPVDIPAATDLPNRHDRACIIDLADDPVGYASFFSANNCTHPQLQQTMAFTITVPPGITTIVDSPLSIDSNSVRWNVTPPQCGQEIALSPTA
jgi:hypothetical protein